MSLSGEYNISISALGIIVTGRAARTGTIGIDSVDTTLPVGHAGTLTTDTIAMVPGHGLDDGTFDVHGVGWCRYGCTLDFTGDSAVVTGGAGDDLADGAVVVTAAVTLDVTFDGANLELIGVGGNRQTSLRFLDSESALIGDAIFLVAGAAWGWAADMGTDSPLTGNAVASVEVSNGDAVYPNNIKITGLQYAPA